jgi:hypothetical protein
MKPFSLLWAVACAILLGITFPRAERASAQSLPQGNACAKQCVCEGFTAAAVYGEYWNAPSDENGNRIFTTDCARLWYREFPRGNPGGDLQAKIQAWIDGKNMQCEECRKAVTLPTNTSLPTAKKPILLTATPTAKGTPTNTPIPKPIDPQVIVELSQTTHQSYLGVAADGVSYLIITLQNTDPDRSITVSVDIPEEGELTDYEGKPWGEEGVTIAPEDSIRILYHPPAFLPNDVELTERRAMGLVENPKNEMFMKNWFLYGKMVALSFHFSTEDGQQAVVHSALTVFRPPIHLVHGYEGSKNTFLTFAEYLTDHNYTALTNGYPAEGADTAIETMAMDLKADILQTLAACEHYGIRVKKVDIVAHSMGGLISRYLVEKDPDPENIVRKLIMLATPNHGVNDWFDGPRLLYSMIIGKHKVAAAELNYNDEFIKLLNEGENEGKVLNPAVEYANLVGQISCLFSDEDGIVPHVSSYLNEVPTYRFERTVHTGAVNLLCPGGGDLSITENRDVLSKVVQLLQEFIPRDQFLPSRVQIEQGTGDVRVRGRQSDQPFATVWEFPAKLEPYQHLRTGEDSRAVIGFYLGDKKWGEVYLAPESEIAVGESSLMTVKIWMVQGNARYITRQGENTKFETDIASTLFEVWQYFSPRASVYEKHTDYVVSARDNVEVYALDGDIVVTTMDTSQESPGTFLNREVTGQHGITVLEGTGFETLPAAPQPWWEDPFYPKEPFAEISPLPTMLQNGIFCFGIPAACCLGGAFVVVLIGVLLKKGKK